MKEKLHTLLNGRVKYKTYGALCSLEVFTIDGVQPNEDDFFFQDDVGRDRAEDYCCGNMQGTPMKATDDKLKKYNLTVDEFNLVAEAVAEEVSWGSCGWCS